MRLAFAVFALGFLLPLGAQAQTFSSLEERMSAAEFKAAGLDKLTPEELAALNAWLQKRTEAAMEAAPAAAPSVDNRGFSRDPFGTSDGPIVSRIAGEFRGWDGTATVFTLENGQVWKSTDPAAKLVVKVQDPIVTIRPGVLNAWVLKIQGYNASVRVIRVK